MSKASNVLKLIKTPYIFESLVIKGGIVYHGDEDEIKDMSVPSTWTQYGNVDEFIDAIVMDWNSEFGEDTQITSDDLEISDCGIEDPSCINLTKVMLDDGLIGVFDSSLMRGVYTLSPDCCDDYMDDED